MSDLLRRDAQDDDDRAGSIANWWSPLDQLQVALEARASVANPQAVGLALGMSLSAQSMPAFIRAGWLDGANLLVPTTSGVPIRAGRLKVMPVFTDTEALGAWLPSDRLVEHPCFGPPPDGVELVSSSRMSDLRDAAGAVMIILNPAGPGGYQVDPEDGALDRLEEDESDSGSTRIPEHQASQFDTPPLPASPAVTSHVTQQPQVRPPAPAVGLVEPAGRIALRGRIHCALDLAASLVSAGEEAQAVDVLAAADRLAELMGDYLHRAEMMMAAARILDASGRRYAAGRLAHYAVLASSLCARGRVEMEAVRLRAHLQ